MRRWLRFRLRTLMLGVTVLSIVVGTYAVAWPEWKERQLVESLRAPVLKARTSAEAGKAYKELVRRVQRSSLKRLMRDEDTGIALKAAYELHNVREDEWDNLDSEQTKAFLDFLEQRTGLEPPAWWADCVSERSPEVYRVAPRAAVLMEEGQPVVYSRGEWLELSRSIYYAILDGHYERCAAHLTPFEVYEIYLLPHHGFGVACPLIAVDLQLEVAWQSRVWALGVDNRLGSSGQWCHEAEITKAGDTVAVWGAGSGGSYLETFDAVTGENQYRFCTEDYFCDWLRQ